jgi:hypothetical protein
MLQFRTEIVPQISEGVVVKVSRCDLQADDLQCL